MNDRAARAVQRKGAAMGAKFWDPEKRQQELDEHVKMAVAAAAAGAPPPSPPALRQTSGPKSGTHKAASKPKGKARTAHSTGRARGNDNNSDSNRHNRSDNINNNDNNNDNMYSPAGLVGFGPSSSIGTLGMGMSMGFGGVLNNDEELLASGSLLGLKDSLPGSLNAPVPRVGPMKRESSEQLGPEVSAMSGLSGFITESSGEMDEAVANGAGTVHGGGAGALGGGNKRSRKGMLALNAQGRLGAPSGGGGGGGGVRRAGAAALGPPDHIAIASALVGHLGGGRSGVVIPGGVNAPGSSSSSMFRSVSAPAAASLTRLGNNTATSAAAVKGPHQHQHHPSLTGNSSRRSSRNADPYAGALNSEISMKWGHEGGGTIDASSAEQLVRNARAREGGGGSKDLFAWSRQNSQVN